MLLLKKLAEIVAPRARRTANRIAPWTGRAVAKTSFADLFPKSAREDSFPSVHIVGLKSQPCFAQIEVAALQAARLLHSSRPPDWIATLP